MESSRRGLTQGRILPARRSMANEREWQSRSGRWYLAAVAVSLVLGAALRWPALATPRYLDDHAQLAMIEHAWPVHRGPLDLFAFARPGERDRLADVGVVPWWTSRHFALAMGRPLASALAVLDHGLFGRGLRGPHLHSLLWWAAAVLAAAALLRDVLPWETAALATLLYAVDEAHTLPVAWLANRSVLVATALGIAGTVAHLHWRSRVESSGAMSWSSLRDGWRVTVWFTLAALAGEYATACLAYVLAWELVVSTAPMRHRALACLPALAPVVVVLGLYRALGYGASGSGQYLDPLGQPASFFLAALVRIPALLADQLFSRTADGPSIMGAILGDGAWVGVSGLVALTAVVAVQTRAMDSQPRRRVVWLVTSGLLAMVPVAASIPSSRLLVASGVGFSGALAMVVRGVWTVFLPGRRDGVWGVLVWPACVTAAALHLGMAPYRTRGEARFVSSFVARGRAALVRSAPPRGTDRVVVLAAADPETLHYPPQVWREAGRPVPARWAVLSMAPAPLLLVRPDRFTLELRSLGAPFLTTAVEDMYRPHDAPMVEGDDSDGAGFVASVVLSQGGRPLQVRFRFERDLDAPGTVFVLATATGLSRLPLPGVHGGMVVQAPGIPGL